MCAVPHPLLNHTVKYCFSAHLQGRNVSKIAVIKTRMNLVYTTYRAAREERKRKADAAADLIFSNQKSGRANRHVRHNLIRPSITEREREREREEAFGSDKTAHRYVSSSRNRHTSWPPAVRRLSHKWKQIQNINNRFERDTHGHLAPAAPIITYRLMEENAEES